MIITVITNYNYPNTYGHGQLYCQYTCMHYTSIRELDHHKRPQPTNQAFPCRLVS